MPDAGKMNEVVEPVDAGTVRNGALQVHERFAVSLDGVAARIQERPAIGTVPPVEIHREEIVKVEEPDMVRVDAIHHGVDVLDEALAACQLA